MSGLNIVITGASTGLGYALTEQLVARGHSVLSTCRSERDAARLGRLGCEPFIMDVTQEDDIQALAAHLEGKPIHALVNNAGIALGVPMETASNDLNTHLAVNVLAPIRITRALKSNLRSCQGKAVFVSSVSGQIAFPYVGSYAASKHALEAAVNSWRREEPRNGIQFLLVQPSSFDSAIWGKASTDMLEMISRLTPDERTRHEPILMRIGSGMTAKRSMTSEDVARKIVKQIEAKQCKRFLPVGLDAQVALFGPNLRNCFFDWVIGRSLKP